jgi:hypothetical protein
MRTFRMTLFLLVVCLLIAPAPAQAWWGWLEELSGPGKFSGPQFEFRLVCFGEESEAKRLIDTFKRVRLLTSKIDGGTSESVKAAGDAWRDLIAELNATRLTLPVIDATEVNTAAAALAKSWKKFHDTLHVPEAAQNPQWIAKVGEMDMKALIGETDVAVQPLVARVVRGITSIGSTGVFLSACSVNKKRRSSIEVGVNLWHTGATSDFANRQEIKLTTLMTLFSFRIFPDPRFDFVDAGVGGGVYWFTSTGFDSFSGVILQPGRLDFHAPTLWATYPFKDVNKRTTTLNTLRRIAAAPSFRYDVMFFPAGFDADAFAGVGEKHVPISGERVNSWSLFINLAPFVPMAPFKDTSPKDK